MEVCSQDLLRKDVIEDMLKKRIQIKLESRNNCQFLTK